MYACAFVSIFPFSLVLLITTLILSIKFTLQPLWLMLGPSSSVCTSLTCPYPARVCQLLSSHDFPVLSRQPTVTWHCYAMFWHYSGSRSAFCSSGCLLSHSSWLCGDVGLYPLCFPGKQQNQMRRPKFKKPFHANLGSV